MTKSFHYMICALAVSVAHAAGADASAAAPEAEALAGGSIPRLDEAWAGWRTAARAGEGVASREAEDRVLRLLQEWNMADADPLAAAAIQESRRRGAEGRGGVSVAAFATQLAPSMPQAHWAHAMARFEASPFSVGGWIGPMFQALRAAVETPRHSRLLLLNGGLALGLATLLAGVGVLGVGLVRHGRRALHDLRHLLPGHPPSWAAGLLFGGVLAILAAFAPHPALLFAVVAIWLARYARWQERIALSSLLLLLGFAPMGWAWLETSQGWGGTAATALQAVERGDLSRLGEVRGLATGIDPLPEAMFALGRTEARAGRFEEAKAWYDEALRLRPGWVPALVNRGNLAFLEGDLEGAQSGYQRAVAADPEVAEAWFGLSRVHYRNVEILEGQAARERALALDPKLVVGYAMGEEDPGRANRFLADVDLSTAALLGAAGEREVPISAAFAQHLWGAPAALAPTLAGVSLLVLFIVSGFFGSVGAACARCGGSICLRCGGGREDATTCRPCELLSSKRAKLDPAARIKRERAVERHQRLRALLGRLASFFWLGPLVRGQAIVGLLLLLSVGVAWFALVGGGIPPLFLGAPLWLRLVLWGPVLAMGLWLSLAVGMKAED